MRKTKSRVFVWVYMGILCCVIAVGIALCLSLSGVGMSDMANQQASIKSAIELELSDGEVPLSDGITK